MKAIKTVDKNGDIWYCNEEGQFHREDGPAIEYLNGDRRWFINGKHHRDGGPAIEYTNGDKYWMKYGRFHREDGPAVEDANGQKEYWLNHKRYDRDYNIASDAEWIKLVPKISLLG
jgi:hypothetical protein